MKFVVFRISRYFLFSINYLRVNICCSIGWVSFVLMFVVGFILLRKLFGCEKSYSLFIMYITNLFKNNFEINNLDYPNLKYDDKRKCRPLPPPTEFMSEKIINRV